MSTQLVKKSLLATVDAIVSSPKVSIFNVGITMDPQRRHRQYVRYSVPKAWEHMAFLAYGLRQGQAQEIERAVFEYCTGADKRSARYRKYSEVKRSGYRRSAGGRRADDEAIYSVYLAWCDSG